MYHNNRSSVAAARTQPVGPVNSMAFAAEVQLVARQLLLSTPDKSASDRQFLQDVARAETRFPLKTVERMARLAATSRRPEHQHAFAELIRKYSTPAGATTDLVVASARETEAEGYANCAVHRFEHDRTRTNRDAAKESATCHLVRLREMLDAIEATPVYQ